NSKLFFGRFGRYGRENLLDLVMRTWYYVNADQFTDSAGGGRARVRGCFFGTHIAPDPDRDISPAEVFFSDKQDVGGFHHSIRSLDSSDESLRLYQSQRIKCHPDLHLELQKQDFS